MRYRTQITSIEGLNVPREFYGDFIAEAVAARMARLTAQGVTVQHVEAEVEAVEPAEGGLRVLTTDGRALDATSVDIAPGGPPTRRIEGDEGPFSAPSPYGHEAHIAERAAVGEEIFCLGGKSSMLDVMRLCQSVPSPRRSSASARLRSSKDRLKSMSRRT